MFFLLRLAVIIQATWLSPLSTAESIAQVDKDSITFSSNQAETTVDIIKKLTTQHFQKQPIDDALSQNLLTQYLGLLDPTKSYFLQEDINEFQKWKFKLDDLLKSGDLSPGFFIYKRYQQRASKRLQENIALLESGFIFDLNKDESLSIDTEANKWQDSTKDSDNYWRKKTKEAYLRLKLNDKDPEEVRKLLIKRYTNLKKRIHQSDSEDVFQLYMNALTGLFDPHTSYLSPRSMKNFRISLSLSLTGIGAVLELDGEHTTIVSVIKGGPADKQGILKTGDKIVAVAQKKQDFIDVVGWRLDDVVELIRGKKNSLVRLEIVPAKGSITGANQKIEIVRDKIQLEEQAAKSEIIEVPTTVDGNNHIYKIGVIEIPTFYLDVDALHSNDPDFKSTTKDVVRLINELHTEKNVDGFILDLRNNGGGFLQEATMLTDLFIGKGPIVQVKNANNVTSRAHQSRSSIYYNGPLLVLINRLSASASEIFAGAIQDYNRGLIVGSKSYGKGTVQIQLPLKEGQIKLTESKFYRVSGESTQLLGIIPDIELPSPYDIERVGESALKNALPWDTIAPAKHSIYWSALLKNPPIDILRRSHHKRLLEDPDLVYLKEELSLIKERSSIKELSLNEKKRKMQSQEYDNNLLAIENKRRKAKKQKNYVSIEEWRSEKNASKDKNKDEDQRPLSEKDLILYETGNIFADYLNHIFLSSEKQARAR